MQFACQHNGQGLSHALAVVCLAESPKKEGSSAMLLDAWQLIHVHVNVQCCLSKQYI